MKTAFANCGFADTVASAYGGRNRLCAEAFVRSGKTFEELEVEVLDGQQLAGIVTTNEIFKLLKARNAQKQFPLFATVYLISQRRVPPDQIFHPLGDHLEQSSEL
jgi:glycerol-3-phosphate dehydrogenase (NAD+)